MRRSTVLAMTLAMSLAGTTPALAGDTTGVMAEDIGSGLVLSGDDAVWAASYRDAPPKILAAGPGQEPRTLWRGPEGACHGQITDLAASDTAIAAIHASWEEGCESFSRLVLLEPDGTPMEAPAPAGSCQDAVDADFDGDRLALVWSVCRPGSITVTDLTTGVGTSFELPPGPTGRIALAGPYVAMNTWGMSPFTAGVVVMDAGTGREVYSVDLQALGLGSSKLPLDIAPDGTLAVLGQRPNPYPEAVLVLASPTREATVTEFRATASSVVALADGLIATNKSPAGGVGNSRPVLYDHATGRTLRVGDRDWWSGSEVAWNGARVAWVEQPAWNVIWIRNQTLAEVEAAAAAPPAPPDAPVPGLAPAAPVTTSKTRCRVPRLRGSTVAAARRKLARAGCRLGRVSGKRARAARGPVVAKQTPRAGRLRVARTRVDVKLRLVARR